MRTLLIGLLAACSSSKDKPAPPPVAPPPPAPVVKCDVGVDADHNVTVNGVVVIDTSEAEHRDAVKPVSYPHADRVAVTWIAPGHYFGYAGGSALIDVPCANPAGKDTLFTQAGADFGHSVLVGDLLYFSKGPGVSSFDIWTRRSEKMVTRPPKADRGCNGGPDALEDIVLGYSAADDAIAFARGGPCGFEGDWEETRWYLDHPAAPKAPRLARPVAALAKDAGGGLWASSGDCKGTLARSTDGGATWTRVDAKLVTSPDAIFPDAKDTTRLVVHTAPCGADAGPAGWTGETLAATRNGGATWTAIALPRDLSLGEMASGDNHARLNTALALRDGSADKLTLSATDDENKQTVWTSDDAGKTWKVSPTATAPAAPPRVDGWEPSPDGLIHDSKHVYIP